MLQCSVIILLVAFCAVVLAGPRDVIVERNKIFINNQEFLVKGVDYSPTPLGRATTNMGTGYGGTGFCSPKLTPWYEWKSACYDSDYFDGSADIYTPSRFPRGFAPVWERDFANIKAIGTNTIRIYNANPSTKAATQIYTDLFTVPAGKDHTQFMALCEKYEIYVIFPLLADQTLFDTLDEFTYRRYLRWQIDEVGNSSSLLMWQLGNEMKWSWQGKDVRWNDTATTAKFNRYVDYIRRYTLSKWGRNIPVTAAMVNIQTSYEFLFNNYHVDVFSANVFGNTYDSLFKGSASFLGITKLACQTNKPFLMSEIGQTFSVGKPYAAGNLNGIWYNIIKNIPYGLVGALYFEQTDEPTNGNKDFGCFSVSVNVSNGANSTQADAFIPDKITPKQQFYDLKSGTYNNSQYNMNANMFSLLGRSAYTLSNVPDYCTAVGTYKTCPGTFGLPKCSGNGACNRVTGTCSCVTGWQGTDCSVAVCPGTTPCSGKGKCSTYITPPECYCNDGYYGANCTATVASVPAAQCPSGCSGNGKCNTVTGTCACYPGWVGADCAVTHFGYGDLTIQQFYVNCFADSNTSRDFALTAPAPSTPLTNQGCRYYCALRGYTYAGTQGGNICSCDTLVGQQGTSTKCTTACAGDSQQNCGGTLANSAYNAGSLSATGYKGCYSVNATAPALPYLAYNGTGSVGHVDSCRQACSTQGYSYAGLQSGSQCWCGNSLGLPTDKAADSSCSSPCAQDSTIKCGGVLLNSVYTAALASGYAYY